MVVRTSVVAVFLCGTILGCSPETEPGQRAGAGDDPPAADRVERDSLPSGVVLVANYGQGLWPAAEREVLVEGARVAGTGVPDEGGFGRVNDVTRDALGRIYVADAFAHRVQVFDSSGSFLRSLGREGEGPGEFENPYGFVWRDSLELWVLDFDQPRVVVFDTAGRHVRTLRRPPIGVSFGWESTFDGGLLVELAVVAGPEYLAGLSPTDLAEVAVFPNPTSGIPPEVHAPFFSIRSPTSYAVAPIPFAPRYSWGLDGRGGLWIGWGGEYRIVHRTLAGDTTLILTRPDVVAESVTAADRARAVEQLPKWANAVDLPPIPDTKPLFWDLVPAHDGGLWVIREGKGDEWFADVFSRDGVFLGQVDLPFAPVRDRRPYVTRDGLVVMTKGSLDIPYVVYLRRVRGSSSPGGL